MDKIGREKNCSQQCSKSYLTWREIGKIKEWCTSFELKNYSKRINNQQAPKTSCQ